MNNSFRINKLILCLCVSLCVAQAVSSQEVVPVEGNKIIEDTITVNVDAFADSLVVESVDSVPRAVLLAADSLSLTSPEGLPEIQPFKPNPTKALILSAIVPGLGQIYNRKYWKLPIIYGGLMGCVYAMTWNHGNYTDYSNAYWATVQENPLEYKDMWQNFVTGSIDWNDNDAMLAKAKDKAFQNQLKGRKDYFRRFRDMSIFIGVGVYVLGMLDAYVDAHLFDFDISPDLSMRLEPAITPATSYTPQVYGINCSINF